MIEPENLLDFIKNTIQINSTIIYFGIGTKYYGNENENTNNNYFNKWDYKDNQQFPPFLFDAKLKFFDKKILIILIDSAFEDKHSPYIVSDGKNFLQNSWEKSNIYGNLYESTMGISVITMSKFIRWDDINKQNYLDVLDEQNVSNVLTSTKTTEITKSKEFVQLEKLSFNIVPMLIELSRFISNPEIDSLMFYHEFTGSNTCLLESIVKQSFDYDDNKICIDITRGANLSCYFNLTNPEFYPVIKIDDNTNKLKYLNHSKLSIDEITKIISQYKKFGFKYNHYNSNNSNNSNNSSIFDINDTNYLIDKPDEMIIFFQIYKSDLIIVKLIEDSIVTTIRQLYSIKNYNILGIDMWGVKNFGILENKIKSINFNIVVENLKLIDEINQEYNKITDKNMYGDNIYIDNIDVVKDSITTELYNIFKLALYYIFFKYDVDNETIDNFINELKNIQDKYEIMNIFKEFVKSKMSTN